MTMESDSMGRRGYRRDNRSPNKGPDLSHLAEKAMSRLTAKEVATIQAEQREALEAAQKAMAERLTQSKNKTPNTPRRQEAKGFSNIVRVAVRDPRIIASAVIIAICGVLGIAKVVEKPAEKPDNSISTKTLSHRSEE